MEIKALLLQLLVASLIGFMLFLITREQMYKPLRNIAKVFASKLSLALNTVVNGNLMSSTTKLRKELDSGELAKRSKY